MAQGKADDDGEEEERLPPAMGNQKIIVLNEITFDYRNITRLPPAHRDCDHFFHELGGCTCRHYILDLIEALSFVLLIFWEYLNYLNCSTKSGNLRWRLARRQLPSCTCTLQPQDLPEACSPLSTKATIRQTD